MLSLVAADDASKAPVPQMLALARPGAVGPIAVLGPDALDLMLQLCALGYDEVVCRCGSGLPNCSEKSHLVLIGGSVPGPKLVPLLRDAASLLGDEGALVVQLADVDQDRVVEAALAARGLSIRSTVFDLSGSPLVHHRVRRAHEAVEALRRVA